jgi:flagellar motor protein MotB
MATRFGRAIAPRSTANEEANEASPFGAWGPALAVLALVGLIAVPIAEPVRTAEPAAGLADVPSILAAIQPGERSLEAVERAFETLCLEPVLLAVGLEPNCETGVITIGDERFEEYGSPDLRAVAQEDLLAAMRIYLDRLRSKPDVWDRLEAIEVRGHSDPRALRDAYATNLVGSQQRPLGVLLFLVGPTGLSGEDRIDLERLATVSGASFSRPPESCPEEQRDCYSEWRRVEIRPVLSERLRREDWSRTLEAVRRSTAPHESNPPTG